MAKKPDGDKPRAIVAFPTTSAEQSKLRNKAKFGDKICALRKARGFSQPQLADMLGVTKNSITNWEKGTSRPELAMIPKLCVALGISTDMFFGMPAPENRLNESEQEHMKLYRSLDRFKQRSVDTLMESIHNRMPVLLPAEAVADWLNIRYDAMDVLRAAMLNVEYRPA